MSWRAKKVVMLLLVMGLLLVTFILSMQKDSTPTINEQKARIPMLIGSKFVCVQSTMTQAEIDSQNKYFNKPILNIEYPTCEVVYNG